MSTTNNQYSATENTTTNKQETGYVGQATGLLSSAAATVSSYLPTGVTNAMSGQATEATPAYRNQQPHVGGVGDLGTQSTQDVTRLPEERQNPEPFSGNQTNTNIGAANPAFTSPSGVQSQYNDRNAGETFPSGTSGVGGPTSQTGMSGMTSNYGTGVTGVSGHQGQPGGVGDLGTTTSTADVAVLPEERVNPDPFNSTTGTTTGDTTTTAESTGGGSQSFGVGGHPGSAGGVSNLGTKSTEDVAVLPDERANPDPLGDGLGGHGGRHHDITKHGSTGGHTGANYDVDHGLGMPHTRSAMPTSTNDEDRAQSHQADHGTTYPVTGSGGDYSHSGSEQAKNIDRNENTDDSVTSPKEAGYPTGKPKLMDKVKGTVMIAKAKMGGVNDEEKIHQGQMLKETGKKVNPEEEARRQGQEEL